MGREKLIESPVWNAGDVCVVCGSPYIQRHHIIGGTANRKVSDKRGYIIPLCYEHHIGSNGIHRNLGMDMFWKQQAQKHYEKHIGTRGEFLKEFGKSYL